MKKEELRIGNLITTDDGIICSTECIESKQFTEWNSGNDYSITGKEIGTKDNYLNCINDSWKPIPLSEEVLFKCSQFKKDSINSWDYVGTYFHLIAREGVFIFR